MDTSVSNAQYVNGDWHGMDLYYRPMGWVADLMWVDCDGDLAGITLVGV